VLALRQDLVDLPQSHISRLSALISSRSSVVRPGFRPRSRSAWRTQLRSVWSAQPIFSEIELIAAQWELY